MRTEKEVKDRIATLVWEIEYAPTTSYIYAINKEVIDSLKWVLEE